MHAAMNVGVFMRIGMDDAIDYRLWFLATGGVIKIYQGFVTNFLAKNRKVGADLFNRKCAHDLQVLVRCVCTNCQLESV
jgi:hypothetical protein